MSDKSDNKSIFIITGEQSGDSNAALLIKDIIKSNPDTNIYGIGGNELESAGMKLLYNYREVNFIGLYSVITNLKGIKNILNKCVEFVKSKSPDLVILVDFPSFNLKFAEEIKKFYKGKIIYYISPQIWVWNTKRVEKIKKYIDRMLVIYPFEVDFYKSYGVDVDYVGNPLLIKIENYLKNHKRIKSGKKLITLLPGSRDEEFRRNLISLEGAIEKLRQSFNPDIFLLLSPNIDYEKYKDIITKNKIKIQKYSEEEKYNLILNSDVVITKFGTSSTECAFLETPFLTIYKANLFNYYIAKLLVKVKYATLINIMANKSIVQELIQNDLKTENICNEIEKIINDDNYRENMINEFKNIKKLLSEYPVKKTAVEIINEYLFSN